MTVFRLGVLACDHIDEPTLIEAAEGADYHDMCADLVRRHQPDLDVDIDVRVYDAVGGQLPESPDECDGWIITGSRHDAYGDDPWLVALREFIVQLYEEQARTVGICFGHQAIAHALGGEAAPAGCWKIGPHEMVVESTPWFAGETVALYGMHRDVAVRLPNGGVAIGQGTTAEHPIYLVGDTMLCMQDHPEFSFRYEAALIESRRARTGDELADEGQVAMAAREPDSQVVSAWITQFLLDHKRLSVG